MMQAGLVAFIACAIAVPLLCVLCRKVGLVDNPDRRKQHIGQIPLAGGISIFLATLGGMSFVSQDLSAWKPLIAGSPLLLLGLLDDKFSLSAALRFPVQILCGLVMVFWGGVQITEVGNLFGDGSVILSGSWSVLFSVLCVVGVINSINMIDGVDGLSGSILLFSFLPLLFLLGSSPDAQGHALLICLITSILAFLLYNSRLIRSSAALFLGDAGSMFLGFVLVWYFVQMSQGGAPVLSAVAAGWLFGLPLADTISVIIRRIVQRRSPFDADRLHFHHLLLDSGIGVNGTLMIALLVHMCFVTIGIICNYFSMAEPLFFWLFVAVVVVHYFFAPRLIGSNRNANDHVSNMPGLDRR